MKNNLSLLKPFDREAAENGDKVCSKNGDPVRWVGRSRQGDLNITERIFPGRGSILEYNEDHLLRMEPICWVEGRPVYRGDVLYWNGEAYPVSGADFGRVFSVEHSRLHKPAPAPAPDDLTWTPPKVKREGWVNVYLSTLSQVRAANTSHAFNTKEEADAFNSNGSRLACVRIEWEE